MQAECTDACISFRRQIIISVRQKRYGAKFARGLELDRCTCSQLDSLFFFLRGQLDSRSVGYWVLGCLAAETGDYIQWILPKNQLVFANWQNHWIVYLLFIQPDSAKTNSIKLYSVLQRCNRIVFQLFHLHSSLIYIYGLFSEVRV